MANYRVFVEKKIGYQTEAHQLLEDLNDSLNLNLKGLRLIHIYDVFNVSKSELEIIKEKVLSEVVTDLVYEDLDLSGKTYFAVEYLPGQFDQRADSCIQCIQLVIRNDKVIVKSGDLYLFEGDLPSTDLGIIKDYIINPVEMREKDLKFLTIAEDVSIGNIEIYNQFINYHESDLEKFKEDKQLAMSLDDLLFIQDYFKNEEKRNPTETEIYMLDTYWSDHCRHTTFESVIKNVSFPENAFGHLLKTIYQDYIEMRQLVHENKKPQTLMDIATIYAKALRKQKQLTDLEVSEEINACSIYVDVDVDGDIEKWLLMFKNETHNHPTEIEPFGGASTCIGGAIRDPLSGRSYVYQAMRISGAANILEPVNQTIEGKLPQKKISKDAALGYSSYGNQIGIATTCVKEIYHDGYKAKRMEVGAVCGAVKASDIKRETPKSGDIILLIGGRTGRDGIGGATGSSKEHHELSIKIASSEVQKGNAPTERKLQRFFKNQKISKIIKKSNDFGAGGVSVAIGELATGLEINLNKIKTKYKGLNPTELAISESQERMAVVIDKNDLELFIAIAIEENLEATVVATVTDTNRLVMKYNGIDVVNISRDFLNTNGVRQITDVKVSCIENVNPFVRKIEGDTLRTQFLNNLTEQNVASQKGLIEMFDSSIGAQTVLAPLGGSTQLTEADASVQKIPVFHGETSTCSIMTYGYNPLLSSWSPFHGAIYAIIESISKVVSVGGDYRKIRFTFQEYFKKLGSNPSNWGLPFSSLLGALYTQKEFGLPAIGGKDSMSGSFKDLHVPPTLISFAVTTEDAKNIVSQEFKAVDNYVYLVKNKYDDNYMPNITELKDHYQFIYENIKNKQIISAYALKFGGLAEGIAKMSFGNKIGINISNQDIVNEMFDLDYGSILIESQVPLDYKGAIYIGRTCRNEIKFKKQIISIDDAIEANIKKYNQIYPIKVNSNKESSNQSVYNTPQIKASGRKVNPQVFIPVFPGTNCEYDSERAFSRHGAKTNMFVFRNQNKEDIKYSIDKMVHSIKHSQIIMLSGGFSAGDEPDGSGKFITAVLQNSKIKESIHEFLDNDGLILGICNGFQALIKSGLLPYGKIGTVTKDSPTLVRNDINHHVAKIVNTKITSNKSPWLMGMDVGTIHKIPISHGEGKFVASIDVIQSLFLNGQVATQYVDSYGNVSYDGEYNPNGSFEAIEGITNLDGRILGKMGHSERFGNHLYKNIDGNKVQDIFLNGINYFRF